MAKKSLVDSDLNAGLKLIEILDLNDFGVAAAVWLYSGDTDTWKLTIGFRGDKELVSRKYHEAARLVSEFREQKKEELLDLSKVRIIHFSNPLFNGLKPIVRADGIIMFRVTDSYLNNIFIEDAIIHRMAA